MPEYRVYKPRLDRDGKPNGSATKWESNIKVKETKNKKTYKEVEMFLTGTLQKGTGKEENAVFDWYDKTKNPNGKQVIMKLGDPDVAEILTLFARVPSVGNKTIDFTVGVHKGQITLQVLSFKEKLGSPGGTGLFHKNANGNSTLQITYQKSADPSKYDDYYKLRLSAKDAKGLVVIEQHITLGEAETIRLLLEGAMRRKYMTV